MSKTFTLAEVNALELSAADNATILERERIIKLLREKAKSLKQIAESIDSNEYMNAGDEDVPYWGSVALNDFADALIKGENK